MTVEQVLVVVLFAWMTANIGYNRRRANGNALWIWAAVEAFAWTALLLLVQKWVTE